MAVQESVLALVVDSSRSGDWEDLPRLKNKSHSCTYATHQCRSGRMILHGMHECGNDELFACAVMEVTLEESQAAKP